MQSPIDAFRFVTLHDLSTGKTFARSWPHLRDAISQRLGPSPSGANIFGLGDQLSEIFRSVPNSAQAQDTAAVEVASAVATGQIVTDGAWARSQSDVSGAGANWESLVTWYLNLVSHGTTVIAAKRKKLNTPEVIADAICVTLHGYSTTTESDIVVYSIPDAAERDHERLTIREINDVIRSNTRASSVAIVQCKTNWNDNAQIPMLWDLIYRSLPFVQVSSIQLGRNGVTPRAFKGESVKYAFVTVPTGKGAYKPGSVPVTRVLGLSGGNYWGKPTSAGTATGFSEFLSRNFSEYFGGSIQNHIDGQLDAHPGLLDAFLNLEFKSLVGPADVVATTDVDAEFDGMFKMDEFESNK